MTTPGQVDIGGETIAGIRQKISELVLDTLPKGMTWEQLAAFGRKDRMRVQMDLVLVRTPGVTSKYDAQSGDETGDIVAEITWKPLREGFEVLAIQTASDRAAAWQKEHTA